MKVVAETKCGTLTVNGGTPPPPECIDGYVRCLGTQRQLCQGGQWVNAPDPDSICSGPNYAYIDIVELVKQHPINNPKKNESVILQAIVKNNGTAAGTCRVKFVINGNEQSSDVISLAAGQAVGVQATFIPINAGSVQVCCRAGDVTGGTAGSNKCITITVDDDVTPPPSGSLWDRLLEIIKEHPGYVLLGATGVVLTGVVVVGAMKVGKKPEQRRY